MKYFGNGIDFVLCIGDDEGNFDTCSVQEKVAPVWQLVKLRVPSKVTLDMDAFLTRLQAIYVAHLQDIHKLDILAVEARVVKALVCCQYIQLEIRHAGKYGVKNLAPAINRQLLRDESDIANEITTYLASQTGARIVRNEDKYFIILTQGEERKEATVVVKEDRGFPLWGTIVISSSVALLCLCFFGRLVQLESYPNSVDDASKQFTESTHQLSASPTSRSLALVSNHRTGDSVSKQKTPSTDQSVVLPAGQSPATGSGELAFYLDECNHRESQWEPWQDRSRNRSQEEGRESREGESRYGEQRSHAERQRRRHREDSTRSARSVRDKAMTRLEDKRTPIRDHPLYIDGFDSPPCVSQARTDSRTVEPLPAQDEQRVIRKGLCRPNREAEVGVSSFLPDPEDGISLSLPSTHENPCALEPLSTSDEECTYKKGSGRPRCDPEGDASIFRHGHLPSRHKNARIVVRKHLRYDKKDPS